MASIIGAIRVQLGLDSAQFTSGLKKSQQQAGTFSKAATGAFSSFAKGALLAVAPILSVSAALGTAKAALADFDRIAKNAKASGLDGEAFQEFAYSAELGGVSTDEFAKALETFNKNAGLAAEGKGRMVTQLKALNPELLKSILATKDQAARFRLAADAIDQAATASEKAALAAVLFGDSGTRMVEVLKGGSAALAETAKKARELGIVIDNDLLARAETMNDELETATKVMDLQFKQALIDLAPFLVSTAQLAGNLASAINYLTESMQGFSDRSTARLEEDYNGLMGTLAQANVEYAPGVVGNMGVQIDGEQQAEMQAQADAMRAELKRRAIAKLASDLNKPTLADFSTPGADTGGSNAAVDAALKQAEAVRDLVANLQHEQDQLGRTAHEQELYNALKSVGVTAESEFGQEIAATLGPLQEQRDAIAANAEMMGLLGDIGRSAVDGIINALADGKIEAEEFGDILSNVLGMAGQFFLNAAFSGLGGGGGFNIMSLFGGGGGMKPGFNLPSFDGGGSTGDGPRSGGIDGIGGRLGIFHPNETVIDHSKGQGGPSVSISISGSRQDAAEIARQVGKILPDAIKDFNSNPYRRT